MAAWQYRKNVTHISPWWSQSKPMAKKMCAGAFSPKGHSWIRWVSGPKNWLRYALDGTAPHGFLVHSDDLSAIGYTRSGSFLWMHHRNAERWFCFRWNTSVSLNACCAKTKKDRDSRLVPLESGGKMQQFRRQANSRWSFSKENQHVLKPKIPDFRLLSFIKRCAPLNSPSRRMDSRRFFTQESIP